VTAAGIAVRWAHLVATVMVVGAFAALLLAGRSRWVTGRAWEERVLAWSRGLLLAALGAGVLALAHQAALAEGRAAAALEPGSLVRLLLETQGGHVWLARHGLLVVLAGFVLARPDTSGRPDWLAVRGEAALLAMAALMLGGIAGHAAAVDSGTALAVAADGLHLLATGAWVGALPPLALLLRAAARDGGADARPYAVIAVRRFSWLALSAVLVLAVTGLWNTRVHAGTVAGVVGTPYGRLLLVKLGLLVPILALAATSRRVLLPALSGDGATVGRPAMRRLALFMSVEAGLALAILALVAALGITPPARHEQPAWPFAFRLTLATLEAGSDLARQALVGSQVALVGVVGLLAALVAARHRLVAVPLALALIVGGLALALPPLAVDAYPTTYYRPTATYHATSIARGAALYGEHCAACHGVTGAGDGPAGRGLPRPPADLRAPHTGQHTAGDLFWWIGNGIPRGGMPAFGDRLDEEARWDLVNFVRVLGSARDVRALGPAVGAGPPGLVAPDFAFGVGPAPARALREYRGRRMVLVVLYTLPDSRPRLLALGDAYPALSLLGAEIVAVPRDAGPDAIRRLDGGARVLFPVVTEGAEDIVRAYGLFAAAPHAEFLVDRQGYLRTIRTPARPAELDARPLIEDVQRLNAEPVDAPAPDDHVH
jgi:putative copper resistance protein D